MFEITSKKLSDLSRVFKVDDILTSAEDITALNGGDSEKNLVSFSWLRVQLAVSFTFDTLDIVSTTRRE